MDVQKEIGEHMGAVEALGNDGTVESVTKEIISCFRQGGKLLLFGNGGSAADAQHWAAEFTNKFYVNRQALPAIALTTDTSFLTAHGNDYGFDTVFARQIEALGQAGDVALGITTSGNSKNVILGIEEAKKRGLRTMVFTSKTGGKIKGLADLTLHAQTEDTPRVQEVHELAFHLIAAAVEKALCGNL